MTPEVLALADSYGCTVVQVLRENRKNTIQASLRHVSKSISFTGADDKAKGSGDDAAEKDKVGKGNPKARTASVGRG
jgi:hypothetical protein